MSDEKCKWLEFLLASYESALVKYALGFCRDYELARDAVQDTFIKICKMQKSDFPHGEKSWLYKVCRNRCFEILRKDRRLVEMDEKFSEQEDFRATPAQSFEHNDSMAFTFILINGLSMKHQELVRLKYEHMLSYKEMSELTGYSVSHVGVLLHEAMMELKLKMARSEEVSK